MARLDLSHDLESGLPYPGDPAPSVTQRTTVAEDGYRSATISCSTHAGTHVDAPAHFFEDGATLGELGLDSLRFEAQVVDCTDRGERESIPASRVPEVDADTDLVVFQTGFAPRWGDESYFDHPYLTGAAAENCVSQGCAVGLDTPNVDPTPTERASDGEPDGYPAHDALLGDGQLILENLAHLEGLPDRVSVHAYPLPVDADGAPARVVAEW